MKNLELLKKLVFIADRLDFIGHIEFEKIAIGVNPLLNKNDLIQYSLTTLEIPFESYRNEYTEIPPKEVNAYFRENIDSKAIYYITYILKEIYGEKIYIYILYATEFRSKQLDIYCGSYIEKNKPFTNISRPIEPSEILRLNIGDLNWEKLSSLFPNNNYSEDGYCRYTPEDDYKDEGYDNYDSYRPSYSKYDGAYGYDDDTIDSAFEGDPENYWNVD